MKFNGLSTSGLKMISFMLAKSIALITICLGCSASVEYRETESNVCLNFTISQYNDQTLFIKREDTVISFSTNLQSIRCLYTEWAGRNFTCYISSEKMSICFRNFTKTDVGNFSLHLDSYTPAVETIELKITVPVTTVTLDPVSIRVNAGEHINMTCTTSFCVPPANITWSRSLRNFTSKSTITKNLTNDLFITESILLSSVVKEDNGKQVYCTANNTQKNFKTSATHIITVLYKPEVSSNNTNPYSVKEGETATLECFVREANPTTNITWNWLRTGNNEVLHFGQTYTINNIQRKNAGSYSCAAINSVGPSQAAIIQVAVLYKPDVRSSPPNPLTVEEGQTAKLICNVTDANPKDNIKWKWIKTTDTSVTLFVGSTYIINNIQKMNRGSYNCTASNSVGTSDAATIDVDVQYKPEVTVSKQNPYKVLEGQRITLECSVIDANPKEITAWKWCKSESKCKEIHDGQNYTFEGIRREDNGSYICTAANSVGTSEAAYIYVDVLYKPSIEESSAIIVNESDRAVLTREINSNPLADISWYNGSEVIKHQTSVRKTSIIIEKAKCTDTKNYTLVASNSVQWNVTSLVELLVNCKPMTDKTNITLGVTETTGIKFSSTVIAYPKPQYALEYENGSTNNQMMSEIITNSVNNFTVYFNQTVVKLRDYGIYYLRVNNIFGESVILVNVIAQRRPDFPRNIEVTCEVTSARVKWLSSFNGGDSQTFTVLASVGERKVSQSDPVADDGNNKLHATTVLNLHPSMKYTFYVSTQNKHGNTSSESVSCLTQDEKKSLPIIVGGTVGGLALAVIVIVAVVFLRRFKKHEKQVVKSQRLNDDECTNEDTDDGMKENILYVSAGPRDNIDTDGAVYAAVAKKSPEDQNNANVYADVKKDGKKAKTEAAIYSDPKPSKGLFKKDGKRKQKNGKKQRSKQEVPDVYENSEDIAMTPSADNVYSNTSYNAKTDEQQRGYKNKDGLLYVDVQFDAKKGHENPIIHGEDEKTDYATVEFPMSTSKKEDTSSEIK